MSALIQPPLNLLKVELFGDCQGLFSGLTKVKMAALALNRPVIDAKLNLAIKVNVRKRWVCDLKGFVHGEPPSE